MAYLVMYLFTDWFIDLLTYWFINLFIYGGYRISEPISATIDIDEE